MKKALLATFGLILIGSLILVAASGSKAIKTSNNTASCPMASLSSQSGENCPITLTNSPMGQISSQNEAGCPNGLNCPKCADCPKDTDCLGCPKEPCCPGSSSCTQSEQNQSSI